MDPKEKLVPIWIREYVEWKIAQALGSTVPPASGSALREGGKEFWLRHFQWLVKQLEDAEATVRALNEEITIAHDRLTESHPAGGPPTPDPASQPDSTTEDSAIGAAEETYLCTCPCPIHGALTQPIGVHDYNSLVACLRSNWKLAFGSDEPLTDPQDMIQRLAAEIQNLKRLKGDSVQGLESEVRVPTAESGSEER